MFLIRAAFWLAVVVLLLPGDPNTGADAPRVTAMQALIATRSAITDFSTFCDRNPDVCATGSTAVQVFAAKVRYGAGMISSYMNRDQNAADHGTLNERDTAPSWRGEKPKDGAA
jgi:Family of unknown function (DUF5330)